MSEVSREFSDGTKWGNSIDWDDAPDGSAGGYDRHGNYILPDAMVEIITLRQQSATMQARIDALTAALDYVYRDCKARAEDGVVPLGAGCWDIVCDALEAEK